MANTSRSTPAYPSRIASDGLHASLAIYLAIYSVAAACFALGFYALLQPSQSPNPGTAAYNPPPGTVISYVAPARPRTLPETEGRAAVAEPMPTAGFADQSPGDTAKEIGKSGTAAKTDDAKPDAKTESKPRHSAQRERRGHTQPSMFDQHRPWSSER
jgi:hypothetical protein